SSTEECGEQQRAPKWLRKLRATLHESGPVGPCRRRGREAPQRGADGDPVEDRGPPLRGPGRCSSFRGPGRYSNRWHQSGFEMTDHPRLSVVIPAYNEAESLPELHRELVAVLAGREMTWEILYVDDGSRDGTDRVIESLCASEPRARG